MSTLFGDWVKTQRQVQRFSQEQLAQRVERHLNRRFTGNAVAKQEAGTPANPVPELVSAYAAALGRPLAEALTSLGYELPKRQRPLAIAPALEDVIAPLPFDAQQKIAIILPAWFELMERIQPCSDHADPKLLRRVAERGPDYRSNGEGVPQ